MSHAKAASRTAGTRLVSSVGLRLRGELAGQKQDLVGLEQLTRLARHGFDAPLFCRARVPRGGSGKTSCRSFQAGNIPGKWIVTKEAIAAHRQRLSRKRMPTFNNHVLVNGDKMAMKDCVKLGRFQVGNQIVIGRLEGSDISVVCEDDRLARVIASGEANNVEVRRVPASAAAMLPPVDPVARIFGVAVNYQAHAVEVKVKPPARPLIFYKAPSNFVAHGSLLDPNKEVTSKLDYEGEIAIVIGRPCKAVSVESALDYVYGICAMNDGSARDLVKLAAGNDFWPDWTASKGLDGASALGPTIACGPDVVEALRRRTLTVTTRLNGEVVQKADMSEMIFSTEQIIAALSSYMTLLPGDVIATGTPAGVGAASNRFLNTSDELEVEISGLDALRVKVG